MKPANNNAPNQIPPNLEAIPAPVVNEPKPILQKSKTKVLPISIIGLTSLLVLISIVLALFAKSQKTALVSISSPSPTISPPLNPTANQVLDGNLENWKTYTIRDYNLNSEILKNIPNLTRGNIIFKLPPNWIYSPYDAKITRSELKVANTGIGITKPNLSLDISAPDEPTHNVAIIMFFIKEVEQMNEPYETSLYQMLFSDVENFGFGSSPNYSSQLKGGKLDNLPAYYLYNSQEDADSPATSLPTTILVALSPTTVLNISIDFYFSGDDVNYYNQTVEEIYQFLSTFRFANEEKSGTPPFLDIKESDKACTFDKDCVPIRSQCGTCEYSSVNLSAKEKYTNLYDSLCEGWPEAPFLCAQFKVKCVEKKCRIN